MWYKQMILLVIILFRKTICATETVTVHQPDLVITAQPGKSVTLNCTFKHDIQQYMFWYKQKPGEQPVLMVVAQALSGTEFKSGFDASDYTIEKDKGAFNLTIKRTTASDEASYFCGLTKFFHTTFGNGTYVALTKIKTAVSDSVHSSHPGPLTCTVLSDTRTKEFRVLWFKPTSEVSRPVSIYIQTNCSSESESVSHHQSCIYKLPVSHSSESRTFYCAVALYGQLLFGNRVTLDKKQTEPLDPVFVGLLAALALCIAAISFLAYLNCKRRTCTDCKGHSTSSHTPSKAHSVGQGHEAEGLNYAALQFKKGESNSGRKKRRTSQEGTYSEIRSFR